MYIISTIITDSRILAWANEQFYNKTVIDSDEYDCSDAFRLCEGKYPDEEFMCARGCCGSCEWTAIGPDEKLYMLGFNYGH